MIRKRNLAVALILTIAVACRHQKATQSPNPAPAVSAQPAGPPLKNNPTNGVYLPGEEEAKAIQGEYPGTTLDELKLGHSIYTGACSSCHEAKTIYNYTMMDWSSIMPDMAMRSQLKDQEKAAVWKYVMAIRAANPSNAK